MSMGLKAGAVRGGRIVTFYSYKGGTGRSMALANVAWVLASNGKRVLVVDWDLEAPGLHRYLHPFLIDGEVRRSEGLIDCIIDYTTETVARPAGDAPTSDEWALRYANVLRFTASLNASFRDQGRLDFLGAGRQDAAYSIKVNTFDWKSFYERHGGGAFLELVKERMRAEYDYVLIDSRTGVSDTAGICTVQMPDDLVVCFTLNNQSILGASRVALSALAQRDAGSLRIFPVPTRVEQGEKEKAEGRLRYARERFALLPSHLEPEERERYWGDIEVPYVPYYAYEEILAPFGDEPGRASSVLASAERLTRYLTGDVKKLVPPDERERRRALRVYAQVVAEEPGEGELEAIADQVFERLSAEQQGAARRLFLRLVRVPGPGEEAKDSTVRVSLSALDPATEAVAQTFLAAEILSTEGSGAESGLLIRQPALIEQWVLLREWLDAEREFLVWRQILRANIADWEANSRDAGALLSGKPLSVAVKWKGIRGSDLTPAEREYIAASRNARRVHWLARASIALVLAVVAILGYRRSQQKESQASTSAGAIAALVKGDSLAARGMVDSAALLYSQAINFNPDYAAAYVKRGQLLGAKGDTAAALGDFTNALRLDDTLAAAWFARGELYRRQGDNVRAIADLQKGLTYDSRNADAYVFIGAAEEAQGYLDAAIRHYSTAINLRPTPDAYFARGVVYTRQQKRDSAAADYEQVIRIATDSQDVAVARARLRQLGFSTSTGTRPPVAPSWRGQVLLFYRDSTDGRVVMALAHTLDSLQFTVGAVTRRTDRSYSAVVYFLSTNQAAAEQLQRAVEYRLATHGVKVSLQLLYRGMEAVRGVGPNDIAVWLPSLSPNSPRQAY